MRSFIFSKHILTSFLLIILSLSLYVSISFLQDSESKPIEIPKAQIKQKSLYIRVDKSYVKAGESYTAIILKDFKNFIPYSGNLQVGINCDEVGNNCQRTTIWRNFDRSVINVRNGTIKINIPRDVQPFSAKNVRFKPYPDNENKWRWSNPVTIGVETTRDLADTQAYFNIRPRTALLFTGVNNTWDTNNDNKIDPIPFKTLIIYGNIKNVSNQSLISMYFIKDKPEGYWNPITPWLKYFFKSDIRSRRNLQWVISLWRKEPGWKDTYITAVGDARFAMDQSSPFLPRSVNQNTITNILTRNFTSDKFQEAKIYTNLSSRPTFPYYVLAPRFVANGWGDTTADTGLIPLTGEKIPAQNLPQALVERKFPYSNNPGVWSVHADIVNTPEFGKALRLKFYEAEKGFISDPKKYALREDWYFVKNKGLVLIEKKNFCPEKPKWGNWKNYPNPCKPCNQDPDCLAEKMTSPHVKLWREREFNLSQLPNTH